jgi:hypothetical protein
MYEKSPSPAFATLSRNWYLDVILVIWPHSEPYNLRSSFQDCTYDELVLKVVGIDDVNME